MGRRFVVCMIVAILVAMGCASVAGAAERYSNTQCVECHDVSGPGAAVDFSVGAVSMDACVKCHGDAAWYSGHAHSMGKACIDCHDDDVAAVLPAPPNAPTFIGFAFTPYGRFVSADPLTMSPAALHAAHDGTNWVQTMASATRPVCSGCHAAAACDACHTGAIPHADHAAPSYPGVVVTQATGTGIATSEVTCLNQACHPAAAAGTGGFVPTCDSCHDVAPATHYDAVAHTAAVASDPLEGGVVCGDCHLTELLAEHARTTASASSAGCSACHVSPRDSFEAWGGGCSQGGCHPAATSTGMHEGSSAAHAPLTTGDAGVCTSCHEGDLTILHANATDSTNGTRSNCLVCHSATAVPVTKDCTTCHFTYAEHPYPNDLHLSDSSLSNCAGDGCHASRDLLTVHQEKVASYACADCHDSSRADVQAAIASGSTGCPDCHSDVSDSAGHRGIHWANPQLFDGTTPGYAYGAGSTGGIPTSECADCHTSNIIDEHLGATDPASGFTLRQPRRDDSGAALTCATCHAALPGTLVAGAIASGSTKCDACHVVHQQIPATHTSTFTDGAQVPCTPCHTPQIEVGHNGTYSVTTPSGQLLTGCQVCHSYFEAPRGTTVQGAITSHDTRCSACHSSSHPDEGGHYASSADSLECGQCHAKGLTSIDVRGLHPSCATCHANPARVADIASESAECASCHVEHENVNHLAPSSQTCVACHETDDAMALHAGATEGPCAVCHDNAARVPALPVSTDCVNCHGTLAPVDSNHYPVASHTAADSSEYGYACSTCHALTMNTEHLKASSGSVTCASCHETKVDSLGAAWSGSCAECHPVRHAALSTKHVSSSGACAGATCHDVADVASLHSAASTTAAGVEYSACRVCHRSSNEVPVSTTCTDCHAGHGDLALAHTATASSGCVACHETGDVRTLHAGAVEGPCAVCHDNVTRVPSLTATTDCVGCHAPLSPADPNHYAAADHAATDSNESGIGCSRCHYLDMRTEHAKPSSGAVDCVTCHETRVDALANAWDGTCAVCHATRHSGMSTAHVSTKTACSGTGCHAIDNVATLHAGNPGGGCALCHTGPSALPATTDCGSADCHPTVTGSHEAQHDASSVVGVGCTGCHFGYLTKEHSALGFTCATCHDSTNSAVVAAISAGDLACTACHPAVNGKNRHASQDATEFASGNSSMHRVTADLPGMRSSFKIGTTTYTWTLPAASAFLKTGWTTSSIVTCDKCHTYTSASGPHGATMKVNIDPAYTGVYANATLGSGGVASNVICAKCHTGLGTSNGVHDEGDHSGEKCVACHVKIPHGWRMPRMLAYSSDPVAYRSTALTGLTLESHTPSNWSESDCSASCADDHRGSVSNKWPSASIAVGAITISVTDESGAALSGATVTADGVTATTGTNGACTLSGVSTGAQTVTVTKTGYVSQSKSVTVVANQTASVSFALAMQSVPTNLALNKSATASSQYSSSYTAAKAVDGSTSTYWRSSSLGTQWIRVDLGSATPVGKAVIVWNGTYYARAYRVETSLDGVNWTQRYSTSFGSSGTRTHTWTASSARYVRIYCTSANQSTYQMSELQVLSQ